MLAYNITLRKLVHIKAPRPGYLMIGSKPIMINGKIYAIKIGNVRPSHVSRATYEADPAYSPLVPPTKAEPWDEGYKPPKAKPKPKPIRAKHSATVPKMIKTVVNDPRRDRSGDLVLPASYSKRQTEVHPIEPIVPDHAPSQSQTDRIEGMMADFFKIIGEGVYDVVANADGTVTGMIALNRHPLFLTTDIAQQWLDSLAPDKALKVRFGNEVFVVHPGATSDHRDTAGSKVLRHNGWFPSFRMAEAVLTIVRTAEYQEAAPFEHKITGTTITLNWAP